MNRGDRAKSNRRQTDSQSVSGNQHRIRPQRKERELNSQGTFMLDRLPTGSRRQSGGPSVRGQRLEAKGMRKFQSAKISPHLPSFGLQPNAYSLRKRKARDSNPQGPEAARLSKPARQAISGYLPHQWTSWESNPSHRSCKDQSPPSAVRPSCRGPSGS